MTYLTFYRSSPGDLSPAGNAFAADSWLEAMYIAAQMLKALHSEQSRPLKPRHCLVQFDGKPDVRVDIDPLGHIDVVQARVSPGILEKWLKRRDSEQLSADR